MICKYCSAENPNEAIFCKNCGKRIDGKKPCPKCNALIDETSTYCTVCGARVDGKKVCPDCGTAYDGNFCPDCGAKTDKAQKSAKPEKPAEPTKKMDLNKIFRYVFLIAGYASAAFAFIFMFFIGVSTKTSPSYIGADAVASAMEYLSSNAKMGIFDCFGKNFDFVDSITAETSNMIVLRDYFYAILQTIIAATTLILVITFFSIATYRFVQKMRGVETKDPVNMFLGTLISYVIGALSFKSLFYAKIHVAESLVSIKISLAENGATTAGLILSLLCCAVMIGTKLVERVLKAKPQGTESLNAQRVAVKPILCGVCLFTALIFALVLGGQFAVSAGSSKITGGFMFISGIAGLEDTSTNAAKIDTVFTLSLLGTIITICIIVLLILIALKAAKALLYDREITAKDLALPITILIVAIVFTVISIICKNYIIDLTEMSGSSTTHFRLNALPVFMIIIPLFIIATVIVNLKLQNNQTDTQAENL